MHHLAPSHSSTKRKAAWAEPKKRHEPVRKLIIELNRALNPRHQNAEWARDWKFLVHRDHVVVFTGETHTGTAEKLAEEEQEREEQEGGGEGVDFQVASAHLVGGDNAPLEGQGGGFR